MLITAIAVVFCFHPSKEGFKVNIMVLALKMKRSFHPSKEGFKVQCPRPRL